MARFVSRWFAAVALSVFASACGDDPAAVAPDAGADPRINTKVLTRVGAGILQARPGDVITLQALLAQGELGPIGGGTVAWKITEDPGVTLSDTSSKTDQAGIAESTLTVEGEGDATIVATSAGATGKASWKIHIAQAVKCLSIIDTPEVTVQGGATANVEAVVGRAVTLRVKVTTPKPPEDPTLEPSCGDPSREVPVAAEPINFAFATSAGGAQFQGSDGRTQTRGDGEASIILSPGNAPLSKYDIIASGARLVSATFKVTVRSSGGTGTGGTGTGGNTGPTGSDCVSSDRPCPLGYTCNTTTGLCTPGFGDGCADCNQGPACTDSANCTGGRVCTGGFCMVPGVHCDPSTNQCVPDDPCQSNSDCPTGFACQDGICVPPASDSIDVTGHWYTKHQFDLREALPGWVRGLGTATRLINQLLQGQLSFSGVPGWAMSLINGLIQSVVQSYVPDWVVKLVNLLDNLFTIFSQLRAEGEMDLVENGGPRILAGTESWNSFVFYILAQCLPQVPSSPTPACARVDAYASDMPADVRIDVQPFSAKVAGTGASSQFVVDSPRQARMKLQRFIKWAIDYAVNLTLGYPSLEDKPCPGNCPAGNSDANGNPCPDPSAGECGPGSGALSNLIDCASIGQSLSDLTNNIVPETVFEAGCNLAVSAIGNIVAQQLTQITVTSDVLTFTGESAARPGPTPAPASYAEELGFPDFETRSTPDGKWTGKFSIGLSLKNVPGRWRASRNPIQ